MTTRPHTRRIALVLALSFALVAAALPFCQLVACHGMAIPMSSSSATTFAAVCGAPASGALSSGALAENSLLALSAFATFALAFTISVPLASTSVARASAYVTPTPPDYSRGIRLVV